MIALSSHTRVAFVGGRSCGGAAPWPWRVRHSACLEGIGKHRAHRAPSTEPCNVSSRVLCDVPSTAEPAILRSSTSSILSGSLYPPSSLYSATLLGMPLSQALTYSLTASPPLRPLRLLLSSSPSTSPSHAILLLLHLPLCSGSMLAFRSWACLLFSFPFRSLPLIEWVQLPSGCPSLCLSLASPCSFCHWYPKASCLALCDRAGKIGV